MRIKVIVCQTSKKGWRKGVNDVLQCPEIDGTNCPKTDVFPVQNEKGGSFPASLRFYKSTWYVSFFLR